MTPVAPGPRDRRVRHQARDAAALMIFSAVASVALATAFVLLTSLGG